MQHLPTGPGGNFSAAPLIPPPSLSQRAPCFGLVCSGGGARGAYEAGVIRYLREELPNGVSPHVRFDVLAGTSIGAMTVCLLAATMHMPKEQGRVLANLWRNLTLEQVFKVEGESVLSVARKLYGAAKHGIRPEGWRLYDVLHPEALERIVHTAIDWSSISANLAKGLFSAISVTTTRVHDGKTVVFIQRKEGGLPPWSLAPHSEPQEVVLGTEHALASAAIPLLFRSVRIGAEYYCDGSVRQSTPLTPALRLGADRVLILTMRHRSVREEAPAPLQVMPTSLQLVSRLLNALMVDRTDYDIDRLHRVNEMIEKGRALYGDGFIAQMATTMRAARGHPLRPVKDLVIRPSRDLSLLARPHLEARAKREAKAPLPTRLLHRLTGSSAFIQAELGSYVLFDGPFANELIELGMEDAHRARPKLLEFFDPDARG